VIANEKLKKSNTELQASNAEFAELNRCLRGAPRPESELPDGRAAAVGSA